MQEWEPGVVYMRHLTDGKGEIQAHQCWNRSLFIESQIAACDKSNAKKKPDEPDVSVEFATEEQYRAQRGARNG